jgi:hypothetical protein
MASLIDVANALAIANPTRPSQSYLRRAISTAYYAVFHALAGECADLFIGGGSLRTGSDWSHVFRALDHGPAKNACAQLGNINLGTEILAFADTFLLLQEERHTADYDPTSRYTREKTLELIERAELAVQLLHAAPRADRRTLAVLAMFRKR